MSAFCEKCTKAGKRTAFGNWKAPDNGKPLLYSAPGTAFNNWLEYDPILFDAVRDPDINVFAALGAVDPATTSLS